VDNLTLPKIKEFLLFSVISEKKGIIVTLSM